MLFKRKKKTYPTRQSSHIGVRVDSKDKTAKNGWFHFNYFQLRSYFPEIFVFLFISLAAWTLLQSARLTAIALQIKDKVMFTALAGTNNFESAKKFLSSQDLNNATLEINSALENFQKSQAQLEDFQKDLLGITRLLPQSRSAQNLLSASIDLSKAAQAAVNFFELSSRLSFGPTGLIRGGADFKDLLLELEDLEKKLDSAAKKIKRSDLNVLPEKEKILIQDSVKYIDFALNSAANLKQLLLLGEAFFSGQNRILLLFQNQNELRPTGGFIGSFGDISLIDGKIQNLKISSTYDLDGQLKENIQPPSPILAVNSQWFLRDANWFTSFDQSAKKIISFYEKEGGETPNLVAAITPRVIAELLKITGPLKVESGLELDSDNLLENLQILTQADHQDASNEPKKILGLLFTELFQKISVLGAPAKTLIIQSLQQSLSNKQAILYSVRPEAQKIIERFNWAGKITQNIDRDYLLISGANLGGTKTDLEISQNVKLISTIKEDGGTENELIITRSNLLPNIPAALNKTFIRIYAPEKSEFVEAQGFDRLGIIKPDSSVIQKKDSDVLKWEKSQVQDVASGTLIGKESGKTFFGNWVILQGGESRTIRIKYLLPFKLKKLDRYSLAIQKQAGSLDYDFEYAINFNGRNLEWKNFNFESGPGNILKTKVPLNKDLFFGIVLKKDN